MPSGVSAHTYKAIFTVTTTACCWFQSKTTVTIMGILCFPSILVCKGHFLGVFFFFFLRVHQGHSSLPVSQCATQKCGHSFTFPAFFAPSVVLAPALLWRWNSTESQGWVGEFKGPLLCFWTWEEVDVLSHYLMTPSGQHNTHWSPWISYRCLKEWKHVYTN